MSWFCRNQKPISISILTSLLGFSNLSSRGVGFVDEKRLQGYCYASWQAMKNQVVKGNHKLKFKHKVLFVDGQSTICLGCSETDESCLTIT